MKIIKIIVSIFFLILNFVCQAQNIEKQKCLNEFEKNTIKYWKYNENGKYYISTEKYLFCFFKSFKSYSVCLKGVDTSYIYKILGKKSVQITSFDSINKAVIIYKSAREPNDDIHPVQLSLEVFDVYIFFDRNGKVVTTDLDYGRMNFED